MIVIIDYGMGNLGSVAKATEVLGKPARVSSSISLIKKAKKIIFPGVGHFARAVWELKKRRLFDLLKEKIKEGIPFLGICLGMQLLLEESQEAKGIKGLGIIKGKVKRFRKGLIVPHMGWNRIELFNKADIKAKRIFTAIPLPNYFYFAHSYYCVPKDKGVILASTFYGDDFASVLYYKNIWAVQFHPEKSQRWGLKLLSNFLNLT